MENRAELDTSLQTAQVRTFMSLGNKADMLLLLPKDCTRSAGVSGCDKPIGMMIEEQAGASDVIFPNWSLGIR
jgi:hypothetical protein